VLQNVGPEQFQSVISSVKLVQHSLQYEMCIPELALRETFVGDCRGQDLSRFSLRAFEMDAKLCIFFFFIFIFSGCSQIAPQWTILECRAVK
jgi:hypothetical protein